MPTSTIPEYTNLSGMQSIFENGVLKPITGSSTDLSSQSVLLIGTAIDGPINTPVLLPTDGAEKIFGAFTNARGNMNGSTLTFAAETLQGAGVGNIIAVRVDGAVASAKLSCTATMERVDEVHEQYLGVATGYTIDLEQKFVNSSSVEIKATNRTNNEVRVINKEKYRLVPESSVAGTDAVIINGTGILDVEDIVITFQYNNLVGGDPGDSSVPIEETDLILEKMESGYFKTKLAKNAHILSKIETSSGIEITRDEVDVYGQDIVFKQIENIPMEKISQSAVAVDQTTIAGKTIVLLDSSLGIPNGKARILHDDAYPLTADVVIGSFDIKFDGTNYYCDISDIASLEKLAETVTTDEETTVKIRYECVPKINISYFITNGLKDGSITPTLDDDARTEKYILDYVPKDNKVYLYSNGNQILNSNAVKVIGTNQVVVFKSYITENSRLEVRFEYEKQASIVPSIEFKTVGAGSLYNDTTCQCRNIIDVQGNVMAKEIVIDKPEIKKAYGEGEYVFSSFNYLTLGDMVDAINASLEGFIIASTNKEDYDSSKLFATEEIIFEGGEDGINQTKEQLFKLFGGERDGSGILTKKGIFHELEAVKADFCVPLGVYADDILTGKYDNFVYELCMFCATSSMNNVTMHGIIETRENKNISYQALNKYVDDMVAFSNEWFIRDQNGTIWKNEKGVPADIGKFVTIICGPNPLVTSPTVGLTKASKAVVYAAMQSLMPYKESGTRWPLPVNVQGLTYSFSLPQVNKIIKKQITTFGYDEDGVLINWDGCCSAASGSEYNRLSVMKTIRECTSAIRKVAKPYLGRAITTEDQTAITSLINDALSEIEMEEYDVEVIYSSTVKHFKDAKVQLQINTFDELRKVTTVIGLM